MNGCGAAHPPPPPALSAAPRRYGASAFQGCAEGVLPAQAVATLRGIPAERAASELRDAGVVPARHPVARADPAQLPGAEVGLAALWR